MRSIISSSSCCWRFFDTISSSVVLASYSSTRFNADYELNRKYLEDRVRGCFNSIFQLHVALCHCPEGDVLCSIVQWLTNRKAPKPPTDPPPPQANHNGQSEAAASSNGESPSFEVAAGRGADPPPVNHSGATDSLYLSQPLASRLPWSILSCESIGICFSQQFVKKLVRNGPPERCCASSCRGRLHVHQAPRGHRPRSLTLQSASNPHLGMGSKCRPSNAVPVAFRISCQRFANVRLCSAQPTAILSESQTALTMRSSACCLGW